MTIISPATYQDTGVRRYRDNPLIEALPKIWSPEDAQELLQWAPYKPEPDDLLAPAHLRQHEVGDLRKFIFRLPEYDMYQSIISIMLRDGYTFRHPLDVATQQRLFLLQIGKERARAFPKPLPMHASGALFSGISGLGKSTFFERLLSLYPQAIQHDVYRGIPMRQVQLVWLKISCPYDASITGLLHQFFAAIDAALGTHYYRTYFPASGRHINIPGLIEIAGQIAASHSLGLLVIDELQNLSRAKTGGVPGMLEFFGSFIDDVGAPVIGIGTPDMINHFGDELRIGRRGSASGHYAFTRPAQDDKTWSDFLKALWAYDWSGQAGELTDRMIIEMYRVSQGITSIAVQTFILAQYRCLDDPDQTINHALLDDIANTELALLQPAIRSLASGSVAMQNQFSDLLPKDWQKLTLERASRKGAPKVIPPPTLTDGADIGAEREAKKKKPRAAKEKQSAEDARKVADALHAKLVSQGVVPTNPFVQTAVAA